VGQSFEALNLIFGRVHRSEGSAMSNPINIDQKHSQAIRQEIGERLRDLMSTEAELPASLRKQVDQIGMLEGQSPSIVPAAERWDGDEARSKTGAWSRRTRREPQ
jgi:hypothetical protein